MEDVGIVVRELAAGLVRPSPLSTPPPPSSLPLSPLPSSPKGQPLWGAPTALGAPSRCVCHVSKGRGLVATVALSEAIHQNRTNSCIPPGAPCSHRAAQARRPSPLFLFQENSPDAPKLFGYPKAIEEVSLVLNSVWMSHLSTALPCCIAGLPRFLCFFLFGLRSREGEQEK